MININGLTLSNNPRVLTSSEILGAEEIIWVFPRNTDYISLDGYILESGKTESKLNKKYSEVVIDY